MAVFLAFSTKQMDELFCMSQYFADQIESKHSIDIQNSQIPSFTLFNRLFSFLKLWYLLTIFFNSKLSYSIVSFYEVNRDNNMLKEKRSVHWESI